MMNYYRWFPDSKIIFVAPTRPLVAQQIRAAVGMTTIPAVDVAILLDKARKNRAEVWASKRVFFATPQVVENDLKAGFCSPKDVSLIVIDEAHRSKGNYAYANIVRFISRFSHSFRVLGLTATPGTDLASVQEVVLNLKISLIEIRTEESPDIKKHLKSKEMDRRIIGTSPEIEEIIGLLSEAIKPTLELANKHKVYPETECSQINAFKAMEQSQKVIANPSLPEGLKWYLYFILQLLSHVGLMLRKLKVYGLATFYSYLEAKHKEFTTKWELKKLTNKLAAGFYYHENIKLILQEYRDKAQDPAHLGHPKLEILVSELEEFVTEKPKSRVIVFTEMRESALEIVKALDSHAKAVKPHIFIGQAKEKDKFDEVEFRLQNSKKGRGKKKKAEREAKAAELEFEKRKAKEDAETARQQRRTASSENAQISGMTQKQQKNLIKDFKKGIYNVLVATSIGEEGLDIGEVDMIVFYDATSSPIKNIQRMGRTGRKNDGRVLLLLTESEAKKFDQAMVGYEIVQKQISEGRSIEYCESSRMVPDDYTPICLREFIDPDEEFAYESESDEIIKKTQGYMTGKRKAKAGLDKLLSKKAPKKRFFMPDGVETGFQNASSMVRHKGSSVSLESERSKLLGKSDIMNILLSDEELDKEAMDTDASDDGSWKERLFLEALRDDAANTQSLNPSGEVVQSTPDAGVSGVARASAVVGSDLHRDIEVEGSPGGASLPNRSESSQKEPESSQIQVNSIENQQLIQANSSGDKQRGSSTREGESENQGGSFQSLAGSSLSVAHSTQVQRDFSQNRASVTSSGPEVNSDQPMLPITKPPSTNPQATNPSTIPFTNPIDPQFNQIDDDVIMEKVVQRERDKDIVSMIKNTIGAIGIKDNKVVTNTLKRTRTLGIKRRLHSTPTDEELKRVMQEEIRSQLDRQLEESSRNQKRRKSSPDLTDTELKQDSIFKVACSGRSGFVAQKQETELVEKFGKVKGDITIKSPQFGFYGGKIGHSSKAQRFIESYSLLSSENKENEYRSLRKKVAAQRRYELMKRKK